MRRVVGIGAALLAIPVLFSLFLNSNKHEGALSTSRPAVKIVESPPGLLSDIPSGANTALVKYIDALTLGLHTGSDVAIREVTNVGCECRVIGESFQAIYTKANLVGGSYSLKQSTVIHKSASEVELKVVIHMTNTTHILRKTGKSEIWKGADIPAYFTIVNRGAHWLINRTSVLP